MTGEHPVPVTLTMVATLAKVSVTTASQVFGGGRPVSQEARDRVVRAAEALGYSPRKRTNGRLIGLLVRPPEALRSFRLGEVSVAQMVGSLTIACMERGMTVIAINDTKDLSDHRVTLDGAVLVSPNDGDEVLHELLSRGIPTVSFDPDPSDEQFKHWVGIDYHASTSRLLAHLRQRGADEIGLLVTSTVNMFTRSIVPAYRHHVDEHGGKMHIRIVEPQGGVEAATAAMISMLDKPVAPDAVITTSSLFAVGALAATARVGASVPDDLMIATMMDGILAERASVPITAMQANHNHVAELTAQMMADCIDRHEINPVMTKMMFAERLSTGRRKL